ncbi:hydrogenase maturation protease [Marinilabiliaceae bacterium JC017]|nr:hydrogenase maturation protease [Marinilabiliaceae bacterium JC017]
MPQLPETYPGEIFMMMIKKLHRILNHTNKILFVGIGNVLKHDDGVGVYISNHIIGSSHIISLSVELSIENYIGKINQTPHDLLVLIDCMHFNREPGFTDLISLYELKNHTSNTHNISLQQLDAFFLMPVKILGIQPADISFGEGLTPAVLNTAHDILSIIKNH